MLTIHKTVEGKMTRLNSVVDGCWVNLINPSEDELKTEIGRASCRERV